MGKLPYIPNKKLYAAVMGACSYVRDTGWFNKAVDYYADKYDVDPDEVAKYVRMAQSRGQKAANAHRPKRTYKYFAVEYSMGNERNGTTYFEPLEACYTVARGLTADTVKNRLSRHDDYISEYAPCHWFGRVEACESQETAEAMIRRWEAEARP